MPVEYGKRYGGTINEIRFQVTELTDEILNRFPIENFEFAEDEIFLCVKVKETEKALMIEKEFVELKYIDFLNMGNENDCY